MKNNGVKKDGENLFSQKIVSYHHKLSLLLDSSFLYRYIFVLLVSLFAIGIKYLFLPPFDAPYLLALSAIIISSLYAGFWAGLISTFVTLFCVNILFITPQYSLKIDQDLFIQSIIYISEGLLISSLVERERKERKKAHEQAEQFHVTLASIGDAVIRTDVRGKITYLNKVAEDLTGWRASDAIGKKIDSVFNIVNEKNKNRLPSPVKIALKRNKVVGLTNHTLLIKKDGGMLPIDDSAAPIRDYHGNLMGIVLIFRDITQRRQLEQKKDDFVSIASHELKTPVTSIKLFVQLIKRKFDKNKDKGLAKMLDNVDGQLNKLTELVNDLLDLSRIQSGKTNYRKEMISIDVLAKDTVKDLEQVYLSHKFILEGKIYKKLFADKDRIRQVLINLISNAVKYSPPNNKILIRLDKADGQAIIKIRDFGVGISKSEQSKIFDRFYQINTNKSNPGLGLGLYITSEIIRRHDGKISVDSEVGKGSTFQIILPFSKPKN